MNFTGTIYFGFEDADSWRLFLLLGAAERERVHVGVEWKGFAAEPLPPPDAMTPGQRALAAHAAIREPQRQRRLREAFFTLVHSDGDSLEDELTYRVAAKYAGVDGDVLVDAITAAGYRNLGEERDAAVAAGVVGVPSLVRQGPPVRITTTGAVHDGPARPRLALLDQMLADDGLWSLAKP